MTNGPVGHLWLAREHLIHNLVDLNQPIIGWLGLESYQPETRFFT
jgi:hypothetical protein